MTYYFEYSFNHQPDSEMQEWQVYLTPEEESDYRDDGTDPSDAAMSIATDEIIDLEAMTRQAVSGEEIDADALRELLFIELVDTEADEDEDEPDESEADIGDEIDHDDWAEKITRTVTTNRVTQDDGKIVITKVMRVTRITRTIKTDILDSNDF